MARAIETAIQELASTALSQPRDDDQDDLSRSTTASKSAKGPVKSAP